MNGVVLLNADYSFLTIVSWQKAVCMVLQEKVQVLKNSERLIKNVSGSVKIHVPEIIKLVKYIRSIYKNKVPFNRRNVLIRDNHTCQYCGSITGQMTIDHVLPVSKGGPSSFENCVCCCKSCNSNKADKTPQQAGMSLNKRPFQPTIMEFIKIRLQNQHIDQIIEDLMNEEI